MLKETAESREETLVRLMDSYGTQVLKTCLLFLRGRAAAEDASQETFFRAWRALDRLKGPETEKAWLMKIAVNVCKSALRKQRNEIPADRAPEAGEEDRYPDGEVSAAVNALDMKYRAPVILHYYHGYTAEEAAKILGLPAATVRTRLSRARKALREALKGWYEDE